jgi:hypothetical protein
MATPTTIKTDSKPAMTKPANQRQARSAQCNRGDSIKSGCLGDFELDFLDMDEAGKTADRIIKNCWADGRF